MMNTLYPLYEGFFRSLGYTLVLPDRADQDGCTRRGSAFCWPIEQAHGTFSNLLDKKPDYLFLPHVKAIPVPGGEDVRVACPFVQSEPYVLKAAFPEVKKIEILSPVLDMTHGYEHAANEFELMALQLGHSKKEARLAFQAGLNAQKAFHEACRREGKGSSMNWRPHRRRPVSSSSDAPIMPSQTWAIWAYPRNLPPEAIGSSPGFSAC
jgi:predicted nucleotide-binding protein (sugar kinase/HSP70/actin superfamily)